MKSSIFSIKRPGLKTLLLSAGLCLAMLTTGRGMVHATSCLDLADIPLDTLQEAAPGMVMFVIDDSGSMDWSIMCPPSDQGSGVFRGVPYIFPNPGDNVYTYTNLEQYENYRLQWMSQWAGYNGMYYDPETDYTHWPGYTDANVNSPRSNPTLTFTLDMTATWHNWGIPTSISNIARRHYYTRNNNGTFLVNMIGGAIEYYRVTLDNVNNWAEVISTTKLTRLTATEAQSAGIVTGRTYAEETQNFANWYSFYRRRELTAKSAIANVIDTSDGVYIGLIFINNYGNKDQRVLPVKVTLDGTDYDESSTLLSVLLNYQFGMYGTPLRNGLKKAGLYYQGSYLKPSTFIEQVNSNTYPFFKADYGGSCQQAFTILFSDGYYDDDEAVFVDNADGDGNTDYDGSPYGDTQSDTLADVAMDYFERDLNSTLTNDVPVTNVDPADHQHMVTYTIAFGVQGSLDTELYKNCSQGGDCPGSWPVIDNDTGKIDDMFHAAVNGRGKYIAADNTAELNAAMEDLQNDISTRLGSAAALASNSIQLSVGSVLYQGTYNTSNWYGDVSALPLNITSGVVGDAVWNASDAMPAEDDRTILSYTGSAGIVFEAANLTTAQQSLLTASGLGTAEDIVNYLRGDTSKNVANGGAFRTRSDVLGDFVHSSPVYFKRVVYIGGNDGMLHAFDSDTGVEGFAYVPSFVYENLSALADPGYTHKFYVDNTATVADTGDIDILVCGLNKGGKGYFALDVTDPTSMTAGNVLWEYPSDSTGTDDDMGYSYSKAFIVKTEAIDDYVAIFGNGYDSPNGEAVLYVLNARTGAFIKKFETGVAGCNGLSTPAIVDIDMDGIVDYAFAGDLKGNMWKFDLRGENSSEWDFAYKNGSTPMPLITVKNTSGETQPITTPPEVMLDCAKMTEGRGLMVFFGTGQYLNSDDFDDATVQSLYGIWDWGPMWEGKENDGAADESKYLGTLNADRTLSNMDSSISLLEQTVIYETTDWLVTSDNVIDFYNSVDDTGSHMGWVFDLPESKERSLHDLTLRNGVLVCISTIPSDSPCSTGGSSVLYQLIACSGGRSDDGLFDIDDDGEITDEDVLTIDGNQYGVSGKKVNSLLFGIIELGGPYIYIPDSNANINQETFTDNKQGMFYWRVLGQ